MSQIAVILGVAAVTYAARISGFLVGDRAIPRLLDRFLQYVPAAVFAALITPDLAVGGGELAARLTGVVVAGIVVLRVRLLWAGLAAGMATYWLVRFVLL